MSPAIPYWMTDRGALDGRGRWMDNRPGEEGGSDNTDDHLWASRRRQEGDELSANKASKRAFTMRRGLSEDEGQRS